MKKPKNEETQIKEIFEEAVDKFCSNAEKKMLENISGESGLWEFLGDLEKAEDKTKELLEKINKESK